MRFTLANYFGDQPKTISATFQALMFSVNHSGLSDMKMRYCPTRCLEDGPYGAMAVGFKAGADVEVWQGEDGRWFAKSDRGQNVYPIHGEQAKSEFQPILSCWRGSKRGCVDCHRACPLINPAVKARREALLSPAVAASQRARKRVERFLLTSEAGLAISGECSSEKISNLMRLLGTKGGRAKSEKKRLAAKQNALKRWSAKRSK